METGIERLLAMTYPLRHCEPEAKLSRCYDRDCRVAVAPRNDGKWDISCIGIDRERGLRTMSSSSNIAFRAGRGYFP
jgi:hypothetical protein